MLPTSGSALRDPRPRPLLPQGAIHILGCSRAGPTKFSPAEGRAKRLLISRLSDGEYAFYHAHAPHPMLLAELVRSPDPVEWKIEEGFASGNPGFAPGSARGP